MKKSIKKYITALTTIVISAILLAGLAACGSDKATPSPSNGGNNNGGANENGNSVVMTINGYEITESVYKIAMYNEAVEFQRESDENVSDDEYEEWLLNFFFTEIDGRMPFDIIRERTVKYLRRHTYLIQAAKDAGIDFEPGDITDIKAEEIIKIGDEYNNDEPDEYFISKYEVTKEQYMDYVVSKALIEKYMESEADKQNISDAEIAEYKEEHRDYFLVKTIRSIFLKANTTAEVDEKMTLAEEIKNKIINGVDMKELVAQYSEDGTTNEGIFTYSISENDYPRPILEWLYTAKKGDVEIIGIDSENGIFILKCEDSALSEDADVDARKEIGKDKLEEKAAQESEADKYNPVLNESVYNSYNTIPGDLIPDENAVG